MNSRLALHPDLNECLLEDRTLLAAPGLAASPFLASTTSSASFVVPGTQTGGSGATVAPGPSFFYIFLGSNGGAGGVFGLSVGASVSVYGLSNASAQGSGGLPTTVGSGANEGGAGNSGTSTTNGFGGSVSSGYNFSLSSTNNFGMAPSTLGSVPVHTYGSATDPEAPPPTDAPESTAPVVSPMNPGMSTPPSIGSSLLGKGLGGSGSLLQGPGMPGTKNP